MLSRLLGLPLQLLAFVLLTMGGWSVDPKVVERLCSPGRRIVIGYHTSNWDAVIGILVKLAYRIPTTYAIKKSWLQTPIVGPVLKELGFIAVDSDKKNNTQFLASQLTALKQFNFAIMPEGNRSMVDRWKEGFYHLAKQTDAAIEVVSFNFSTHHVELLGGSIFVTNKTAPEVTEICQNRLMHCAVPLYLNEAYPPPKCLSFFEEAGNLRPILGTSALAWQQFFLTLLLLLIGIPSVAKFL